DQMGPGPDTTRQVSGGLMKKIWLLVSLAFGSLFWNGCGGGASAPQATHFAVGVTGAATAGTELTINVNALDAQGNVVASYMGTVQITSSDPHAELPGSIMLVNGTATAHVALMTAGNQTIAANDALHRLSGMASVSVSPAQVSQLFVSSIPA